MTPQSTQAWVGLLSTSRTVQTWSWWFWEGVLESLYFLGMGSFLGVCGGGLHVAAEFAGAGPGEADGLAFQVDGLASYPPGFVQVLAELVALGLGEDGVAAPAAAAEDVRRVLAAGLAGGHGFTRERVLTERLLG